MSQYESKVKLVAAPVEAVYAKLSNLENLRPVIEKAKNDETVKQKMQEAGQDPKLLDNLNDVELTPDSISVPAGMMGNLALRIIEREENKTIKFQTEESPIQANFWIQILPSSEVNAYAPDGTVVQGSKIRLTLKADLNPMLKIMIGPKLETGINKMADMIAMLPY